MATLGWRWAATTAVWLSYYAFVLVWLVWKFDIPLRPPHIGSSILSSEDELQHLFDNLHNSSWFNFQSGCKEYLLEGAPDSAQYPITNVDTRQLDTLEWTGGKWFYPVESSNPNWSQQHKFLAVDVGVCNATFSDYQVTDVNVKTQRETSTHSVQKVGGDLILKNFWGSELLMAEVAHDVDYTHRGETRDLKLSLLGAIVCTSVDRRMKYPNHRTLTTRCVDAELSSARRSDDPLHFPAFRIIGPSMVAESEYEYRSEEFLQSALNMSSNTHDGSSTPSTSDPNDLVRYLERSGAMYKAVIAPGPNEQALFQNQGQVVVGPFSTPYYPSQEVAFFEDLSRIKLTLELRNVVTRVSNLSGSILVSGSMNMGISPSYVNYVPYVEQRPFNVEGIWDPMLEELCMIGCRVDSLNPNPNSDLSIIPNTGCGWKLCIKSVLRRYVSIDSTLEGAVLSSLYADAHHPGHFAPLAFLRAAGIHFQERSDVKEIARVESLTTYRYTVIGKAEQLAKTTLPEDSALDKRWFHPRYPTPYDVQDFCKAMENMRITLSQCDSGLLYDAEGQVLDVRLDGFMIMNVESCPWSYPFEYLPWDTPLKTPAPGSYLKVAVQLSIGDRNRDFSLPATQCSAEGVYEPFIGKMHLVVHLRPKYFDGVRKDQLIAAPWPLERNGGGDVEVEDQEIYMELQFPSIDNTMSSGEEEALDPDPYYSHHGEYGHRFKVNRRVESLRSQLDPLYFKPFVARNYPLYKPS